MLEINILRFFFEQHADLRLREHALGNFREFVKAITVDPTMLRYLNNNQNIATAPNENYARELVELFTVGKGDLVGPGDYTNYTEADIQAMAKILTGWTDRGWFAQDEESVEAVFDPATHANGPKQLSNRFNNVVIQDGGIDEYKTLVDVIFQQPACARYICSKFYRFFVAGRIDDTVQNEVIEPMSQIMIAANYDIVPALRALFNSEHFFSSGAYGCVIKSPMDFLYGILRQFEMDLTEAGIQPLYEQTLGIFYSSNLLGMEYYSPPNVAGWKAYYQEPGLHRIWINSVSLPKRTNYSYKAINQGFDFGDTLLEFDAVKMVDKMDDPVNVNAVIEEFALILLPQPLSQGQKDHLKSILIPGLPDFEWEMEYLDYTADPTNQDLVITLRAKLNGLLTVLAGMGEFQMM